MIRIEDTKFATLDDTILYVWKNAKLLDLNDINQIIQELKLVLEIEEITSEMKSIDKKIGNIFKTPEK